MGGDMSPPSPPGFTPMAAIDSRAEEMVEEEI